MHAIIRALLLLGTLATAKGALKVNKKAYPVEDSAPHLSVREDSTVGGAGRALSSEDMQPNEVAASADGTGLQDPDVLAELSELIRNRKAFDAKNTLEDNNKILLALRSGIPFVLARGSCGAEQCLLNLHVKGRLE